MTTANTQIRWRVGDIAWQAELYRYGRGLDYGCGLHRPKEEAEHELAVCLGDMSGREREQSEIESCVSAWRIDSVDENGQPDSATGI